MRIHIEKMSVLPVSPRRINWGLFTFVVLLAACGGQGELSQLQLDQAKNALLANQPEQARSLLKGTFDTAEKQYLADCLKARAWHSGRHRIPENSIRYAKSCLERMPDSDEVRLILGSELYLSGEWEKARQWLANPVDHPDYCGQAVRAFSEPDFEVNEKLLEYCLSDDSPMVLEYARRIAMFKGDRDTAIRYAHQLLESRTLSASSYYRLGLWLRAQKQDEQSARSLEISHYLRAVFGRGKSASDIEDKFLGDLTNLYRLGFDDHPDLALREINWYWERGEKHRARERLMELTQKRGRQGHMGVGLRAEAMGYPEIAIVWLQPLAEQRHTDARISLARIFGKDPNRRKEARALLEKLLSSHPYCGVCYLLSYQLNPAAPDAARLLEQAQSLSPWDVKIQNYRTGSLN